MMITISWAITALRRNTGVLVLVVGLFASVGCADRYQIVQDKDGRTVRLDRRTGDVVVIVNDRLIVPKSEQQQAAEEAANRLEEAARRQKEEALTIPRTWPTQPFKTIGVDSGTLTTAWRNGTLRFQLQLTPIPT